MAGLDMAVRVSAWMSFCVCACWCKPTCVYLGTCVQCARA